MKLQTVKGLPNFFIPKKKLLELLEKSSDFDLNIVIKPSVMSGYTMEITTVHRAPNSETCELIKMDIPEET